MFINNVCSIFLLQTTSFDLEDFASAHHKFAVYLEVVSPYIQLR